MVDPPRSRPASFPPGYDEADPYVDEDLDDYPEWWRENIEQFREHGMRPYRPPRFGDDELVPELTQALEAELGVPVRIRSIDPHTSGEWKIWVDDRPVHPVERTREPEGFTRYHLDSATFERIVRRETDGGAEQRGDRDDSND